MSKIPHVLGKGIWRELITIVKYRDIEKVAKLPTTSGFTLGAETTSREPPKTQRVPTKCVGPDFIKMTSCLRVLVRECWSVSASALRTELVSDILRFEVPHGVMCMSGRGEWGGGGGEECARHSTIATLAMSLQMT